MKPSLALTRTELHWHFIFEVEEASGFALTIGEAQLSDAGGVWGVEIYPQHRNKGYGKKLMSMLEAKAREMCFSIDKLWLLVKIENTRAVALYSSLGYKVTSFVSESKELRMEKYLWD